MVAFFFLAWLTGWVTVVVVVFFFFCCDRCLKGLWVVVRSGDDFF